MEPTIGWVWLSQSERIAAEASLSDAGAEGTRDELGFGVIHFAYADRFFPGTSVQHTSLRYVWFICWALQEMASRSPGGPFPSGLFREIEDRTGRRLLERYGPGPGMGVIGGRVLRTGKSPVSKPSGIYWSALRTWSLLAPLASTSSAPFLSDVVRSWDGLTRTDRLEVDAVADRRPVFADPPPMPADWTRKRGELEFDLDRSQGEDARIRAGWARATGPDGRPVLLSRLAERKRPPPVKMNSAGVRQLCTPEEKRMLEHAERAGSLVCVARALYFAMVGDLRRADGLPTPAPDTMIAAALEAHAAAAASLDLLELEKDVPALGGLRPLVAAVQAWLAGTRGDYAGLLPVFLAREYALKGDRAMLLQGSAPRRGLWSASEPSPLTYRWEKVSRFLDELALTA